MPYNLFFLYYMQFFRLTFVFPGVLIRFGTIFSKAVLLLVLALVLTAFVITVLLSVCTLIFVVHIFCHFIYLLNFRFHVMPV